MAILVAEDEPDLSDLLSFILKRSGHEVIQAADGDAALRLWRERKPELVILDIGLPRKDGWEVCQTINRESTTPVIIVSGADEEENVVRGLDLGADDYVVKPFSPRVLQARINNLLRRAKLASAEESLGTITIGDVELDPDWRTVVCGDRKAHLTRLEYSILQTLAIHAGQVVSHENLVRRVWGYKGEGTSQVSKGHIRNLRTKLEEVGSRVTIRVFPGFGYRLEYQREAQFSRPA